MLMGRLKEPDFFKRPKPRGAWRFYFVTSYLDRQMEAFGYPSTRDLPATFTECTADAITRSITDNVKMLSEVLVIMARGRGTRNHDLMSRLRECGPKGLRLMISDEFGVSAQFRGDQLCDADLRHGLPARQQHTRSFRRCPVWRPWQATDGTMSLKIIGVRNR